MLLFAMGTRPGSRCAVEVLEGMGVAVCDHVSPDITHLLLDIPSPRDIGELLSMLPEDITIIGGNLDHLEGYKRLDLLKDEYFLAQNAAITADCAVKIAREHLLTTWENSTVTVIGWGRIGKPLARMLKALGAQVSVLARTQKDRAMLSALGYGVECQNADVVFNTVPGPVDAPGKLKIDLASVKGLAGEDVLWARGLPGIHAPKTVGRLIAQSIWKEEEK